MPPEGRPVSYAKPRRRPGQIGPVSGDLSTATRYGGARPRPAAFLPAAAPEFSLPRPRRSPTIAEPRVVPNGSTMAEREFLSAVTVRVGMAAGGVIGGFVGRWIASTR